MDPSCVSCKTKRQEGQTHATARVRGRLGNKGRADESAKMYPEGKIREKGVGESKKSGYPNPLYRSRIEWMPLSTQGGKNSKPSCWFFSNLNFLNHLHVSEVHQTHEISYLPPELALRPLCFLLQVKGGRRWEGMRMIRCDKKCCCGPGLMTG